MTKTEAAIQLSQACIDWAEDTGDCHFCGDFLRRKVHDEDCPVREFIEAPPPEPAEPRGGKEPKL